MSKIEHDMDAPNWNRERPLCTCDHFEHASTKAWYVDASHCGQVCWAEDLRKQMLAAVAPTPLPRAQMLQHCAAIFRKESKPCVWHA